MRTIRPRAISRFATHLTEVLVRLCGAMERNLIQAQSQLVDFCLKIGLTNGNLLVNG